MNEPGDPPANPPPAAPEADPAEAFLTALFEHVPPGVIELRILEDKKGGRVFGRHWYTGAQALLAVLPKMSALAARKKAGVFFGVLPRRAVGAGRAEDAQPGMATWTDLDFKDYAGGEEEARRRLAAFPIRSTAVIRTAHGLHVYWLMKEPTEVAVLAALAKRLAVALGGDHVADAARILRMPGTMNCKDPENPIPVEIESLDLAHRCNPDDLDGVLPVLAEEESTNEGRAPPSPPPPISKRVLGLLEKHPRLKNLFEGHGKPATDPAGKRLDTTSSGYDFSVARTLVKLGVDDETEIVSALWHRPDDAARTKGMRYVLQTARKALEASRPKGAGRGGRGGARQEAPKLNFEVEKVLVTDSDPPSIEFVIDGSRVRFAMAHLGSPSKFRLRFMEAMRRYPRLPRKEDAWADLVESWLGSAEEVAMPPEASASEQLAEEIRIAVANLAEGEKAADLDQGKALRHEGVPVFKTRTLRKILADSCGEVSNHVICQHLRDLGFESRPVRFGEGVVRVWGSWKAAGEGAAA